MNTIWKNHLQEYCQKQKISLPNYRIKKQSGPPHILKFQAEVEVNGHWYIGEDLCSSKKDAEQSAAKKAYETLLPRDPWSYPTSSSSEPSTNPTSETYSESPPSYSEVVEANTGYHLPNELNDIEQFITDKVGASGGRIRKIFPANARGQYKFEITGSYRYCENVQRHHKKNQIYFIVDPIKRTYFQRCHDTECYGFQSSLKYIDKEQRTSPNVQENNLDECDHCRTPLTYQNRQICERCGQGFCGNCVCACDLCHDATHCRRCFELCWDCHDS